MLAGVAVFAGQVAAASLVVEARGLDPQLPARVAVFASRIAFPDDPRFQDVLAIDGAAARWSVDDLPTGDYAVLVWQDLDDDGALDRSMFGAPEEPHGWSNGARGNRVQWEDARVSLAPDETIVEIVVE